MTKSTRTAGPGQEVLTLGGLQVQVARPERRGRRISKPTEKARRHRQRWTDDEEAWLVQRYRDGAQIWQIALELGRSAFATNTRLYRLGEQRHETCGRCGTPLQQTGEAGHPVVYCAACIQAIRFVAPPAPDSFTCPMCLQTFTPDINAERNLYCSKKCVDAAWYARVRERRDEARRRFGAIDGTVNDAQRAEVRRLRAAGASWRAIEAAVGVHREAAQAVVERRSAPSSSTRHRETAVEGAVNQPSDLQ